MGKNQCNIVWLKRDLRTQDHPALRAAIEEGLPTLVLYCFEPSLVKCEEYSERHWRFVWESLEDMKKKLKAHHIPLYVFYTEVEYIFKKITECYEVKTLFSTQEVGIKHTYDRDKAIQSFCAIHRISWKEFPQDGVIRGLKSREHWQKQMEQWLYSEPLTLSLGALKPQTLPKHLLRQIQQQHIPNAWKKPHSSFQPGGEHYAFKYLQSFIQHRAEKYNKQLSKPKASRKSCGRISPYLAWGNLTARQVIHAVNKALPNSPFPLMFNSFKERVWWRGHYLQKFESDCMMEFKPINRAFEGLKRNGEAKLYEAWAEGKTGFPMIDASMRCLIETGYLNFRMRAMLATFVTFPLWQEWKKGATHLARLFLDFEPGIHYPQYQMQAGLTGYHTLRMYNPTIQATQHDSKGEFIYEWIPELRSVPVPLVHEPWKMTALDQQLYRCELGKDYPKPVINFEEASRKAKDEYWEFRNHPSTLAELPAVWNRLCIPENRSIYEKQMGMV